MPGAPIIGFKGLKTSGNPLTRGPGAMLKAVNMVLTEADELMPRRGQDLSQITFEADDKGFAMEQWGDAVLVHHGPNDGSVGDNVSITADPESGSFSSVGAHLARSPELMRMKFAELAKSQYFTTSTGVFGLPSATGTERLAGVQRPGDFPVYSGSPSGMRLTGNPGSGWMPTNSAVGYRAVIGRKDSNDVVKLSAPCGRAVLINPADLASASLTRTGGNTVTATVASTAGYHINDIINISSAGSADFLAGTSHPYTVTAVTATTLVWTNVGTGANVTLAAQTLSSGTKNAQVWVSIVPNTVSIDAVAGDFVQLYRTFESAGAAIDPGDEEFQCYERTITAADISATYVAITDTTPDSFLGAALYTNANTGSPGGLDFEHLPPPLMTDMAVFDGRMWGTQTVSPQTLQLRLLGVGAPDGLQVGDKIAIGLFYYIAGTDFFLTTGQLPSQNIIGSTQSFVFSFNGGAPNPDPLRARIGFNGTLPTGLITTESVSPTAATFYAAVSRQSAFQEALPAVIAVTSVTRATNVITVTTTAPHGFANHANVVLAISVTSTPDADFPARLLSNITVTGASTFTYASTGADGSGGSTYAVFAQTKGSVQVKKPLRFSEPEEPEAWPLVNFTSGLPDGAVVSRIKSLNGSLYVLLEHGDIYTVSGQHPYSVQKVDGTASIVCPDTLVEFTGRLFFLSTQGVVSLGPGGIRRPPASIDVDLAIRTRITQMREGGTTAVAFAVAYESDHQYQLWLPAADAESDDAATWKAVDAYVFQENTNGWTTWDVDSLLTAASRTTGGRNHGLVYRPLDVELMVGQLNRLIQESKTWTWEDAADGLVPISCLDFIAGTNGTTCEGNAGDFDQLNAGDVVQFPDTTFGTVLSDPLGLDHVNTDGQYISADPAAIVCWRAIAPLTAKWVPATTGTPGLEKHWRDWQLHLGLSCIRAAQVTFETERTEEASATNVAVTLTPNTFTAGTTFLDALSNQRVSVPTDCQRGAMLAVEIAFVDTNTPPAPQAFTQFKLLGMTPTGEDISERTPR